MNYSIVRPPALYVGTNSLKRILPLYREARTDSIAIIADEAVSNNGYLDQLREHLPGVLVEVHVLPPGEPKIKSVNAAADFARAIPTPLVIGVGGGSALDTAKQVAAVLAGEHPLEHYLLGANRFAGRAPLIAIPTTAGTGAEVTRVCVVSDDAGRKLWTWGNELLPDAVILDPAVTLTLPAHVTIATGLDALVHAIEACTSTRRNNVSLASGLQAIRLIRDALPRVIEQPGDLSARQHLQEAAYLAGLAFDQSALGIAHNIGHALGTVHQVPHGVAVAVALDATLSWNMQGNEDAYAPVAEAFRTTPAALPRAVRSFMRGVHFPQTVARFPQFTVDTPALLEAMNAPENQSLFTTNVRNPNAEERQELARATQEVWSRWQENGL